MYPGTPFRRNTHPGGRVLQKRLFYTVCQKQFPKRAVIPSVKTPVSPLISEKTFGRRYNTTPLIWFRLLGGTLNEHSIYRESGSALGFAVRSQERARATIIIIEESKLNGVVIRPWC